MKLYKDSGGYFFVTNGKYYDSPFDHFDDIAVLLKIIPVHSFDLMSKEDFFNNGTDAKLIAIIGE